MADPLTTARRAALARKGKAQPGGRYPIRNTNDLGNAIQAIGRSSTPAATRAFIIRRARELGQANRIPPSWRT